MTLYRCHNCGKESPKKGMCCDRALEKTCGVCGHNIDCCTCTGDIAQTKGVPRK